MEQQVAAWRLLHIKHHDIVPRSRCNFGSLYPGGTRSHNQDVCMVVYPFIATLVSLFRRVAQPCRLTDKSAVEVPLSRHESFVIEPRGEQRSQDTVYCTQIESCTRPTVDTSRLKTLAQGNLCCSEIRLIPFTDQLNKAVGLLRSTREKPTGSVILETPPDDQDIIRHKRGGKSISLIPLITFSVEQKAQRTLPIDDSPTRQSRHFDRSLTGAISCVTVSRSI